MKVYIYAIAKDEAKFVKRFMDFAREADGVYVLDTGSTDGTQALLRAEGAHVAEEVVDPWRFDVARNWALKLVPADADVCISIDLDEVIEPRSGWRAGLEKAWKKGTTRMRYPYVWSHKPDGSADREFMYQKIHARFGYRWKAPCHEVLTLENGYVEKAAETEAFRVEHWPDSGKSRGNYLALLKLGVEEDPADSRMAHYYARELWFAGKLEESEAENLRYLSLPNARWHIERATSMRMIGDIKARQKDERAAEQWFLRACGEAPEARENWVALAKWYLNKNQFLQAYTASHTALAIKERGRDYTTEGSAWGETPHDILSASAWYLGFDAEAKAHVQIAKDLAPWNDRIRKNWSLIRNCASPFQRTEGAYATGPILEAEKRQIALYAKRLKALAADKVACPADTGEGRGIVIVAGGPVYLPNAWVLINILRKNVGCDLPIELWHKGQDEMPPEMVPPLEALGVRIIDALEVAKAHPHPRLRGWELKPFAILHSAFREVLFLDADVVPCTNPERAFAFDPYAADGATFWKDNDAEYEMTISRPLWAALGLEGTPAVGLDSGVIAVDKGRCWQELWLTNEINKHSDFFYGHVYGDKDTFLLAWALHGHSVPMIATSRFDTDNGTMYHTDPAGQPLFIHRIKHKWRPGGENKRLPDAPFHDEAESYLASFARVMEAG